jgi:hypothetical protein
MQLARILWVLFKTAIFTALVPYTVGFWLPQRVYRAYAGPAPLHPWRSHALWELLLTSLLLSIGAIIYLWCAWDFSVKGLGTPAPIDAPKNLVVNGPLPLRQKSDVSRRSWHRRFTRNLFLVAANSFLSCLHSPLRKSLRVLLRRAASARGVRRTIPGVLPASFALASTPSHFRVKP